MRNGRPCDSFGEMARIIAFPACHGAGSSVSDWVFPTVLGLGGVLVGFMPAGPVAQDSLLIEAESFDRCQPQRAAVPKLHDTPWASGRTALIRVPEIERISWVFECSATGKHDVWMRYAATREVHVDWTVADERSATPTQWWGTEIPSTGALSGRRAWAWTCLGAIDGSEGGLRLFLQGAGLRLDCFAITPLGSGVPPWPIEPEAQAHDLDLLRAISELPPRSFPAPWEESFRLQPPAWAEEVRACLHTRLSVKWTQEPVFSKAAGHAQSLGATSLVRHVKSMAGQCFWPSAQGVTAGWALEASQSGQDPVAGMVQRAHSQELAFVAYYRHQEDRPLALEHPDWVCRDALGRVIRTAGEPRLCFHSPFGAVTLQRFIELAERGVDGIYLDESHQPLEGCWCAWSEEAFKAATGLPLPAAALESDPLYRRYLEFTEDSLVERIACWRRILELLHPGTTLLVSSHRQPDLVGPLPTLRLAAVSTVVKTEFSLGDTSAFLQAHPGLARPSTETLLPLGWIGSRDGSFGRPAHVWINRLEGHERWLAATAAVVASGCIANLDHPEAAMPDSSSFEPAFGLARELSKPLARARPLASTLLHLPERARNAHLPDRVGAWKELMLPMALAFEALIQAHLPVCLISDDQLAHGLPSTAKLLFLPNEAALEPGQRDAVRRFRSRGGVVVCSDLSELASQAAALSLPARLQAPESVHSFWFTDDDGRCVIAITQQVAWVTDPKSSPPESVQGMELFLESDVQLVRSWPGGTELEIEERSGVNGWVRSIKLPSMSHALVLRLE